MSAIVEDRTWYLEAKIEKYDPADIETFIEKRRVAPGLRGFCRKRARVTNHRLASRTIDAGWGGWAGEDPIPFEVIVTEHNLLLNNGITRLLNLLSAQGGTQAYDATHSRIGVGDDATAAAASQTDLQAAAGSTHRQFKLVSSGPTVSAQTTTWVATFASGEAQFHWQEFGLDVGTADSTTVVTPMLNRKVADNGTKAAAVWVFTMTLTIS